jgi:predicted nucleotidyltransferase
MIQKSSMALTVEFFFRFPTKEHSLKDVSQSIKIAHTSVKKNLQKLLKSGLLTQRIEKKGRRKFPWYKAKRNKSFITHKKVNNLSALLGCGVISHLEETLMPKSIVVFGSYEKGEDVEDSDVDLFVEGKSEEILLSKFEKKLTRKIQLHFGDFESFSNELKNNIINGTVLHGFLEGYL